MRYDGTLTPEEDIEDRARRQAIYQERNRTVIENRAKRAREAREKGCSGGGGRAGADPLSEPARGVISRLWLRS